MRKPHNQLGNTLALVIALFLGLILLIGFFALNYNQLFGTHQEAQSGIDAASLQAAKDFNRVVINDPNFGLIGLVDDVPAGNDLDNRPVIGINTLFATIRLDAIVSSKLTDPKHTAGNTTMLVLAQQDLQNAQTAASNLSKALINAASSGTATDKNNNTIDIQADVNQAYDENSQRLSQGKRVGPLTITIGGVSSGTAITNTPVPAQAAADPSLNGSNSANLNGQTFYKAYANVSVAPLGQNVSFAAVSTLPTLIDNNSFVAKSSLPSVVQVSGQQQVKALAAAQTKEGTQGIIQVTSTAECGAPLQTFPTGTLCVNFVGGTPSGSPVDFTSIESIMNASQISSSSSNSTGTASPFIGWNNQASGQYLSTNGGTFPLAANATEVASPFRGRKTDDPSVSLSFLAYDWLKSLYLRPNVDAVVQALSFPLSKLTTAGTGATFPALSDNAGFIPPAYAQGANPQATAVSGVFNINANTGNADDPRTLGNGNPLFRQQYLNVFGFVPAQSVYRDTTRLVAVNSDGSITTTNGENVSTLDDAYYGVVGANQICTQTYKNAQTVGVSACAAALALIDDMKNIQSQMIPLQSIPSQQLSSSQQSQLQNLQNQMSSDKTQIASDLTNVTRAGYVAMNAKYGASVTSLMFKNMKVLSGGGIKELSSNHFKIMGVDFYPPTRAATVQDIQGSGPIATGQDSSAPVNDWTAPWKGSTPAMSIYKRTSAPVIGRAPTSDPYFQPALAQTAVPVNQNQMYLVNALSSGNIELSLISTSPFAGESLLNGQMLYQDTKALITTDPTGTQQLIWQVQARDMNANTGGTYFANTSKDSGVSINPANYCQSSSTLGTAFPASTLKNQSHACPSLISEWVLLCPVPNPPTIINPPPVTVVTTKQNNPPIINNPPPSPPPACTYNIIIDSSTYDGASMEWMYNNNPPTYFNGMTYAGIINEITYLNGIPGSGNVANGQFAEWAYQWGYEVLPALQQYLQTNPSDTGYGVCDTIEAQAG